MECTPYDGKVNYDFDCQKIRKIKFSGFPITPTLQKDKHKNIQFMSDLYNNMLQEI